MHCITILYVYKELIKFGIYKAFLCLAKGSSDLLLAAHRPSVRPSVR